MRRLTSNSGYVYYNYHKKNWSVRSRKTGRVIANLNSVCLVDCEFRVSDAGRQRVIGERVKNVHAGVAGEVLLNDVCSCTFGEEQPISVCYDPYKTKNFVDAHSGSPVYRAKMVRMEASPEDGGKSVLAWGVNQ